MNRLDKIKGREERIGELLAENLEMKLSIFTAEQLIREAIRLLHGNGIIEIKDWEDLAIQFISPYQLDGGHSSL